ncbi:hypothetical protein LEP1GSC073_1889 [Leptospira noguchii str. Cascata]|nr:hypothetical protein LEP1GSC072_1850 [Leptospira noguchii str. Bonito]EMS88239.1 hypothetical protein LEP1GSC073_1889 [Leptospira noguchii str. Cascata]
MKFRNGFNRPTNSFFSMKIFLSVLDKRRQNVSSTYFFPRPFLTA